MASSTQQSDFSWGHGPPQRFDRITLLIADDEPDVLEALIDCVRLEPTFEVVGAARSAEEAIALASQFLPDLALLDINMPGGGELAARGILGWSPTTRIVALSGSDDRTVVLNMLRAGAASYVVKGGRPAELVETLLRAARGESILSPEVASGVIGELTSNLAQRDLDESASTRLFERIRGVIDERQFKIVFQPIIDLRDFKTVGVEALSRFSAEPLQGPDRWFADADIAGLRAELELAAATAAVAEVADLAPDMFLSINLSPATLRRSGPLFEAAGGPRLVVEITEHTAINDYDAVAADLAPIRDHGTRVAVDDAGAGFSSLRHALQLAPDFIKLDVSLTHGIDSDPRRYALAAGLIGFADVLGGNVIAEGIESRSELDTLRELGVRYGQGYFLAMPGPLPLERANLSHLAGRA